MSGRATDSASTMASIAAVTTTMRPPHAAGGFGLTNDPRGKFSLDALGNPVMDIYVRKVERVNGKLSNVVIKTYPAVSQFWTYSKKDFLASPVYTRDYPPANNLEK